jgi:hypothetical protein
VRVNSTLGLAVDIARKSRRDFASQIALRMIAVELAGAANGEKVEETPASVRNSAGVNPSRPPRLRERLAPLCSEDLYSPPDHSECDKDTGGRKGVFQGR